MNEEHLHELARKFMDQFDFKQMSLDEFMIEFGEHMSEGQKELGYYILELFSLI